MPRFAPTSRETCDRLQSACTYASSFSPVALDLNTFQRNLSDAGNNSFSDERSFIVYSYEVWCYSGFAHSDAVSRLPSPSAAAPRPFHAAALRLPTIKRRRAYPVL